MNRRIVHVTPADIMTPAQIAAHAAWADRMAEAAMQTVVIERPPVSRIFHVPPQPLK